MGSRFKWKPSKAKPQSNLGVMVNFMCQTDWVIKYPDILLKIILFVSVSMFLDEINVWISRLKKEDCHPQCE